jgi:transposase
MIAVGVDTHKHWHVAVALSAVGQWLGEISVPATVAGYRRLVAWLAGLDGEVVVGIEGTGSYGAGVCEHLLAAGVSVVEVERPPGKIAARASPTRSTRSWQLSGCWPATASRHPG